MNIKAFGGCHVYPEGQLMCFVFEGGDASCARCLLWTSNAMLFYPTVFFGVGSGNRSGFFRESDDYGFKGEGMV